MLGGEDAGDPPLTLTELIYSGTPPTGWAGYSNAMIFDASKDRFMLHGPNDGKLYPFDLKTNSFSAPGTPASPTLRMGTRFSEVASNGGAALKWGIAGSNYTNDCYYVNSALNFYSTSSWTGNCSYLQQCLVGNVAYFFGGIYGQTVMNKNDMSVYQWNLLSTGITAHGTTTMAPLTYNAYCGHDDVSIFIFGGAKSVSGSNTASTDVWRYLLAQKVWQKTANVPFNLVGGQNAPYYDGKFWFLGATTANDTLLSQQLWSYEVYNATWKLEATYPELAGYRTGQQFVYDDKLYYVMPQNGGQVSTRIFTINLK
ncbi:hypothetical protein pEaSNUABM48_00177 [Erwinia phage pEa_SNUABM_48]|nr:hypothetical protein pEaSNUABM48_00177 [Erwinia phage pEa_SNUABM_48]